MMLIIMPDLYIEPGKLCSHLRTQFNQRLTKRYKLNNGKLNNGEANRLDSIADLDDWVSSVSDIDDEIRAQEEEIRQIWLNSMMKSQATMAKNVANTTTNRSVPPSSASAPTSAPAASASASNYKSPPGC